MNPLEEHFDQTFNSNVKGLLFTVQKALTLLPDGLGDDLKEGLVTAVPLGRLGKPEEIAKAVVFLASDDSRSAQRRLCPRTLTSPRGIAALRTWLAWTTRRAGGGESSTSG